MIGPGVIFCIHVPTPVTDWMLQRDPKEEILKQQCVDNLVLGFGGAGIGPGDECNIVCDCYM